MAHKIFFKRRFKSQVTGSLKRLIATSDKPELCASHSFVASALRAAKATQVQDRTTILTDVATVLSCSADELGFLFYDPLIAANDSDPVPVEMPDYRMSLLTGYEAFAR